MSGLVAAPRTGPWREEPTGNSWQVRSGSQFAITTAGRVRTWRRRAAAYAHAEALNRQERDGQAEALKELGL